MNKFAYHRDEIYIANESLFSNIFRYTLNKVLKYKSSGSVLEIGSSTGLLLKLFLEKGWDVVGIEPSIKSAEYAVQRGIQTYNEIFEKVDIKKRFDVIILNHVLEHLEEPRIVLKKIRGLLREDGILVLNVPNAGSLTSKLYKDNWKYRLPEEHRWQFTLESLQKLLNEQNYTILEWEARSGIWEFADPYQELYDSFIKLKKRFIQNLITAIPAWFITKIKMGTGLSVIARKMT